MRIYFRPDETNPAPDGKEVQITPAGERAAKGGEIRSGAKKEHRICGAVLRGDFLVLI